MKESRKGIVMTQQFPAKTESVSLIADFAVESLSKKEAE